MTERAPGPLLVVCYDTGVLTPRRIAQAARAVGARLHFVVPLELDEAVKRVLRLLGDVTVGEEVGTIARALRPLRPDGVTTFSEQRLPATAELAAALDLPHHDLRDLDAIVSKGAQRARLAAHGIDGPRHRVVSAGDDLGRRLEGMAGPVVAKPVVGAGSRNTQSFPTAADCHQFLTDVLPLEGTMIVEELVVGVDIGHPWGCDVGVACVVDRGEVQVLATVNKLAIQPPLREWGGWIGPSPHPGPLVYAAEQLACRAVRALGVHTGICDVEVRLTATGPRIIEVNGRLAGWVDWMATRAGLPAPAETGIRLALGMPPAPTLTERRPVDECLPFTVVMVAPTRATRVRSLDGLARLRGRAGVEVVELNARAGDRVDWRTGLGGAPATVYGTATTLAQLAELVTALADEGLVVYD